MRNQLKIKQVSKLKTRKLAACKLKPQRGVVLIEALIAILIFSMGILALVGLQAAMIKNTSDNKFRADASFVAQERLGRMWADPSNLANYAGTTDIGTILPNGTVTVAIQPRGLVNVTVNWQTPGGDPHNYRTSTYIGSY